MNFSDPHGIWNRRMNAQPNWTAWDNYIQQVLSYPAHHEIRVPRDAVPHPLGAGFYPHLGVNKGQLLDWRRRLPDDRGIHVLQYNDHYRLHWDYVDPSANAIEHLRQDAPEIYQAVRPLVGLALPALVLLLAAAAE